MTVFGAQFGSTKAMWQKRTVGGASTSQNVLRVLIEGRTQQVMLVLIREVPVSH